MGKMLKYAWKHIYIYIYIYILETRTRTANMTTKKQERKERKQRPFIVASPNWPTKRYCQRSVNKKRYVLRVYIYIKDGFTLYLV